MINKRSLIFILIALACAMLLLFIGSKGEEKNENITDLCDYESSIENRLTQLISQLKGVSEVKVMVVATSDYEKVYAKNTQEQGDQVKSEYYTGADRSPVLLTRLCPRISGVAVVCKGGDDILLQQKITELVSDLLNISSGKIFVGS